MLFKLLNLNSNLALTLGYLNPALNNLALAIWGETWRFIDGIKKTYTRCREDIKTKMDR